MRINLNFRDATIQQIGNSEYSVEFDLSKMNKPRLSKDARMYIENINLPEFHDEVFGKVNGELRGYFEIRMDNIDNGYSFDSEFGNTGNTILYTSPLQSFKSFVNNDPMHISNFKINQSFLQDKLRMRIKVYDQFGDPYNTVSTVSSDIDFTTAEYVTYQSEINNLDVLNKEYATVETDYNALQVELFRNKNVLSQVSVDLQEKRKNLFNVIDNFLNSPNVAVRNKLKAEQLKLLLDSSYTINMWNFIFEKLIPHALTLNNKRPYDKFGTEIQQLRTAWNNFQMFNFLVRQHETLSSEYQSSSDIIFSKYLPVFDPDNIPVLSEPVKTFNYKVNVPSGTNKEGTIDITYFNSTQENKRFAIVSNIKPKDITTTHKINQNDVLIIDSALIQHLTPDEFEYFFTKASTQIGQGITLTSITPSTDADKRIGLKVLRKPTSYEVFLLPDIDSTKFEVGDQITIDGSVLGGATSTNDLTLEVKTVFDSPATTSYTFSGFIDLNHTNTGTMDLVVERDDTAGTYSLTTQDYTNTQNFHLGEQIKIKGDALDGDTPVNDLTLTVKDVIQPQIEHAIDATVSEHVIPLTLIQQGQVKVIDTNGNEKNDRTGLKIEIFSRDGVYAFNGTPDTSSGYEVDDTISITGDLLTGISPQNDLELNVDAVDSLGHITALSVSSSTSARYPTAFDFEITRKPNSQDYSVVYQSGFNFAKNDSVVIEGSELGGTDGTNDAVITILETKQDSSGNQIPTLLDIIGTAVFESGNVGQIKSVDVSGKAKQYQIEGRIIDIDLDATATNTPVDVAALTKPDLKITVGSDSVRGLGAIQPDIDSKRADVITAKNSLITVNRTFITKLGPYQEQKMKCLNMSLVLYDEIPDYSQSSFDALKGNTYSRVQNCQFKRI